MYLSSTIAGIHTRRQTSGTTGVIGREDSAASGERKRMGRTNSLETCFPQCSLVQRYGEPERPSGSNGGETEAAAFLPRDPLHPAGFGECRRPRPDGRLRVPARRRPSTSVIRARHTPSEADRAVLVRLRRFLAGIHVPSQRIVRQALWTNCAKRPGYHVTWRRPPYAPPRGSRPYSLSPTVPSTTKSTIAR